MQEKKARLMLMGSVTIFGTIGILRRAIPYSSGFIALIRGLVGALFLLLILLLRKEKLSLSAIRANVLTLLLSGAALGFNWIFLFEAYECTTVATATLCYYLAPILVMLVSPWLLGETLTVKKLVCAGTALTGMVLVTGLEISGFSQVKGVALGLCAAFLYACVMLLNKKLKDIGAFDRTISQLLVSSAILLPYVLIMEDPFSFEFTTTPVLLLLSAGIVHTGIAYWLYFSSMGYLKAQTIAMFSYIDPVMAIFLSLVFLREPLSVSSALGGILILGSAFFSET